MSNTLTIPCPACNTPIPFNTHELLRGAQFTCPKCYASIGLSNESRPVVEKTMKKFDEMKKNITKMKQDNSMS